MRVSSGCILRGYNRLLWCGAGEKVLELVPMYTIHWIVIVIVAAALLAFFFLR